MTGWRSECDPPSQFSNSQFLLLFTSWRRASINFPRLMENDSFTFCLQSTLPLSVFNRSGRRQHSSLEHLFPCGEKKKTKIFLAYWFPFTSLGQVFTAQSMFYYNIPLIPTHSSSHPMLRSSIHHPSWFASFGAKEKMKRFVLRWMIWLGTKEKTESQPKAMKNGRTESYCYGPLHLPIHLLSSSSSSSSPPGLDESPLFFWMKGLWKV